MRRRHTHEDTRRWAVVHHVVFKRDRWRCRERARAGKLECDHVETLQRGGDPWDKANLQTASLAYQYHKTLVENLNPHRLTWADCVINILSRVAQFLSPACCRRSWLRSGKDGLIVDHFEAIK